MTHYDETDPRYIRFIELRNIADKALNDGDFSQVAELAHELLSLADEFSDDWNYGNARHHGHRLLGQIALANDKIASAKIELLASGDTPGSPQLNSFGPNMSLAKSLLEKGEKECVLTYLEQCGKFWQFKSMSYLLELWASQIKQGKIPEFGANLLY